MAGRLDSPETEEERPESRLPTSDSGNRLKGESEWLFPNDKGEKMTPDYFRDNFFYPVLDIAGIQAIPTKDKQAVYVPYSCRHTFSNLLANVSGSDKDKAALIGHEDYKTTKKMYQSGELENMKKITDQFSEYESAG